jgi:hypothetical protein
VSLRPPSGAPPPTAARIDGRLVDLTGAADEVCRQYFEHYPDDRERYGSAGADWCRHDTQWLLSWAVDDVRGATDLCEQARWLARVLQARRFPLERLAHSLELAAEVAAQGTFGEASGPVAARLSAAAVAVAELDPGPGTSGG